MLLDDASVLEAAGHAVAVQLLSGLLKMTKIIRTVRVFILLLCPSNHSLETQIVLFIDLHICIALSTNNPTDFNGNKTYDFGSEGKNILLSKGTSKLTLCSNNDLPVGRILSQYRRQLRNTSFPISLLHFKKNN